jgi:hypothetical protein
MVVVMLVKRRPRRECEMGIQRASAIMLSISNTALAANSAVT